MDDSSLLLTDPLLARGGGVGGRGSGEDCEAGKEWFHQMLSKTTEQGLTGYGRNRIRRVS